jgi:hypothetical protein
MSEEAMNPVLPVLRVSQRQPGEVPATLCEQGERLARLKHVVQAFQAVTAHGLGVAFMVDHRSQDTGEQVGPSGHRMDGRDQGRERRLKELEETSNE